MTVISLHIPHLSSSHFSTFYLIAFAYLSLHSEFDYDSDELGSDDEEIESVDEDEEDDEEEIDEEAIKAQIDSAKRKQVRRDIARGREKKGGGDGG